MIPIKAFMFICMTIGRCLLFECEWQLENFKHELKTGRDVLDHIEKKTQVISNGDLGLMSRVNFENKFSSDFSSDRVHVNIPEEITDNYKDGNLVLEKRARAIKAAIDNFEAKAKQAQEHSPKLRVCYITKTGFNLIMDSFDFTLGDVWRTPLTLGEFSVIKTLFSEFPAVIQFMLFKSMIESLNAFHRMNVTHGYIKPHSFLVTTKDLKVKLIFGLLDEDTDELAERYQMFRHPLQHLERWSKGVGNESPANNENVVKQEEIAAKLKLINKEVLDVWALGMTFMFLMNPNAYEIASKIKFDSLEVEKNIQPLLDLVHSENWLSQHKDYCDTDTQNTQIATKTCLHDIVLRMVNKDPNAIKPHLEEIEAIMERIYLRKYSKIYGELTNASFGENVMSKKLTDGEISNQLRENNSKSTNAKNATKKPAAFEWRLRKLI
jgi:serine/threonine protein kinase